MLSEKFKPIFIQKIAEMPHIEAYRQDAILNLLWEISHDFEDKDMSFGPYRCPDNPESKVEPDILGFFTYFSDRSTTIIRVYYNPTATAEVLAFPASYMKTIAETVHEEFKNTNRSRMAIDALMHKYHGNHWRVNYACEKDTAVNWYLNEFKGQGFTIFPDGSILASEGEYEDEEAFTHMYLM